MSKTMVKYLSNDGALQIVNLFLSSNGIEGSVEITQEYLYELLSKEYQLTDVIEKEDMMLVAEYFAKIYG